jgi:hypothetical protein
MSRDSYRLKLNLMAQNQTYGTGQVDGKFIL